MIFLAFFALLLALASASPTLTAHLDAATTEHPTYPHWPRQGPLPFLHSESLIARPESPPLRLSTTATAATTRITPTTSLPLPPTAKS